MRRLIYSILTLSLGIALTLAGLLGLAATESGTRWLATLAVYFTPGELRIGQTHGTLLRRFELEQVLYRLPPYQFEFAHLTLAWQPKALVAKQLKIEAIAVQGLRYRGPATAAGPITLPGMRLPLAVTIEHAELTGLTIAQGEARTHLERVWLHAELSEDRLTLHGLQALIQPWSLSIAGEIKLQGDYPLQLTLNWRGQAKGLLLTGQGNLSGDLRRLHIDHRLTAPFQATTLGALNALDPDLPVDLHGSWQDLNWPPVTADYLSPQGSYRVLGNLHAYQLTLDAHLAGKTLPALQVHLSGHGDTESFILAPLTVHPPEGQLIVTGKVRWAPAFTWELALEGRDLNPQAVAPAWPGRLELAASSRGQWDQRKRWLHLKIDRLRGSLRQQPVDAAGSLELNDGQWQSDGLDLRSGANRLQLKGRYGKRIDLAFFIDGRRLSDLWPDLHGTLQAQGKLTGDPNWPQIQVDAQGRALAWRANRLEAFQLKLRFAPNDPTSRSELKLSQLNLLGLRVEHLALGARGGFGLHRLELDCKTSQARLLTALTGSYRAKVWQARIEQLTLNTPAGQLAFPGDGRLAVAASLDFNTRPLTLAGDLKLAIPNLARLAPWLPQLNQPQGQLQLSLRAAGPLTQPTLESRLKLSQGAVGIRPAGIRLTAIEVLLAGTQGHFDLTGSLRSGNGRLDFSGWAELPGKLHLTLKGNDLEVVRQAQAQVTASPNLVFELSDRTAQLTGQILLPEADIRLKESPQGSVTVSEDEIIVGVEAKPKEPPFQLTSQVELILGDQVRWQGFGLTARLSGQLAIRSLNRQASAHGVIDLKQGVYKAYGQNLKIETGRLIFTGPLAQPELEIKAVRTIERDGVTAVLEVRGPAQKPMLQVKSQPPLPETEALAYLLTGRSFKSSGAAAQTEVAKAALSMGMELALPWIRKLGLEEVAMKTGIRYEESSLTLGTYLMPDLYVGYAFSLFNGVGKALLRYQLNRFFTIEAGAGTSQSVDLFYIIETD